MGFWYSLFIAFLFFCYIFIIIRATQSKNHAFKLITLKNGANIEPKLLILMHKNPHNEFIVFDKTNSIETHTILEKMELDFPELHIIRQKK